MGNLSKIKREKMVSYIETLKNKATDEEMIIALNEIETSLKEKKFGLLFEEHSEEIDELLEENIPILIEDECRKIIQDKNQHMNFLIEGDNLQALYLLSKTHKGKVDCIYIDPPYNTGAHDWKYNNDYVDENDTYRHSKWLSMMDKRLKYAKKLLNPDTGILMVAIDDNELNTLGLLLESIFSKYKIFCITVVHNPNGNQGKNFGICNEFVYFVMPSKDQLLSLENRIDNPDVRPLRDVSGNNNLRTDARNCFYPIIVKEKEIIGFGNVCPDDFHPESANIKKEDGTLEIYPIDASGIEKKWVFARQTVESIKDELKIEWNNSRKIFDVIRYKTHFTYKSVWDKKEYNSNSYGSKLINKIFCGKRFDYPKSLYLVRECLYAVCKNNKNAIVLDFFAGSGTTFHALNLLNAEDGGNRKCIMVTNNEVSEEEAKKLSKQGFKKGDDEWEALGIAKYVNWPRTECVIKGIDIEGNPLTSNYLISNIPMSNGFKSNIKYLKMDWTPRKPTDYLLSNALASKIKCMLELQNFIEIDNIKNILILNKAQYKKHITENKNKPQIENVWVNQNIIFSNKEIKELQNLNFKFIPREFFGEELKEAGE